MSIEVDSMTPDASIGGAEVIPVSDSGTPKSVTPSGIASYAIDQIEAIAAAVAVSGADAVFVLQGGALKPADIDLVCQHAIDTLWGKAAELAPDSADVLPLKDGATEKTVTLTALAEYVRGAIEAAILDVSDLAEHTTITASNKFLVTDGTTGKHCTYGTMVAGFYTGLQVHVAYLSAVATPTDDDILYAVQGGVGKKVTLSQIADHVGGGVSGTGAANFLAQWLDADTLASGPALAGGGDGFSEGSDVAVPTTAAVRGEMDTIIYDSTDISADLVDADTILVDDGGAGTTQRKSAISRLWTYIAAKMAAVVDASTYGWFVDEDAMTSNSALKAPSQQSVKAYVDARQAEIVPSAVDGTLATGVNADFAPTKLVYNKTCAGSDGNDVIDLHDGVSLGQIVSVYLGTKGGTDNTVVTPVSALGYSTITLDAVNEIATLQWQGAAVGWAILYTSGTIA